MFKFNKKAFTLVELIVVITILAILWTIAFMSMQWYVQQARNSKRVSDINNIRKSLELFVLNTWFYPMPDSPQSVTYSWDLARNQWTVWDKVISNLSKSLSNIPLDPLLNTEYVYSITRNKDEYQVMSVYEWELSQVNNSLNSTYAANSNFYVKVEWNYNEVFILTPHYILATPSIINSEIDWAPLALNLSNIKSQVISGWTNLPSSSSPKIIAETWWLPDFILSATWVIDSDSTDAQKISVINTIQDAYFLSPILAAKPIYKHLLENTSNAEKIELASVTILNETPTVAYYEPLFSSYMLGYWSFDENYDDEWTLQNDGINNWNTIIEDIDSNPNRNWYVTFWWTVSDFVEIPHHPSYLLDEWTFSIWAKVNDTHDNQSFYSKDAVNTIYPWHINTSIRYDKMAYRLQTVVNSYSIKPSDSIWTDWNNFISSFWPDGMKFYLNGNLIWTHSYTWWTLWNENSLVLWVSNVFSTDNTLDDLRNPLLGSLDELIIYDKQLSDSEALELYNSQK